MPTRTLRMRGNRSKSKIQATRPSNRPRPLMTDNDKVNLAIMVLLDQEREWSSDFRNIKHLLGGYLMENISKPSRRAIGLAERILEMAPDAIK